MSNTDVIINTLREQDIIIEGDIVENPATPNGYFVPLRIHSRLRHGKRPSGQALSIVRSRLLELGYAVDFIFIEDEDKNIENSLRASLLNSFPDEVRNVYFSTTKGTPQIWIDFKRQPTEEISNRLKAHLEKFSDIFALSRWSFAELGDAKTATRIEILSIIRQLAPVQLSTLTKALTDHGYAVPSPDWMNRRLDALRKTSLVIRRQDGSYALTTEALAKLGTRKNRRSPDIQRLLALARRES